MADGIVGKISVGDGATFTPHVDADGILTFTNNKNLPNPDPFDIPARVIESGAMAPGSADGTISFGGNDVAVTGWGEKADLASPAFTGNPTAPTQTTNNNSTRIATTEYVVNDLKADTPLLTDAFATTIPSGADLNDYKTAGTYITGSASVTNSLLNCPVTGISIKLIVLGIGYSDVNAYGMQLLFASDGRIFRRSVGNPSAGTWLDWRQVASTENVLSLTGGTLTGDLKIDKYTPAIKEKSSYTRGESLSSERSIANLQFTDKDENQLGGVYFVVNTDNSTTILLRANDINGTIRQVVLQAPTSGNPYFRGRTDNDYNLGIANYRWKQLYAGTTTIATSDERMKDNIVAIPDEVLDAWGEVGWYQYQFKDSIEEKGESRARLHTGAIAQRIESVFTSHGLDANKYGLLCYDEWKSEPAERDEDGNIIQEARPAGNRYSLRYEEALCMEAAYQRRRADRLESRIEALERAMNNANG